MNGGTAKDMSNTERFLDLYKRLESVASDVYGFQSSGGALKKLLRRSEYRNIRLELDYIREVRNLLTHRPKIGKEYAVEPTDAMVRLMEDVIKRIESPATAESIMISSRQILSCEKSDLVMAAMKQMYERAITHIPILEDGKVAGVFSENIFIRCTISGEHVIDENTVFYEIEDELAMDKHLRERYAFTGKNTPVQELSDLFDEAQDDDHKLGMIFVTEHGKEHEKLIGIITAWDVAASFGQE